MYALGFNNRNNFVFCYFEATQKEIDRLFATIASSNRLRPIRERITYIVGSTIQEAMLRADAEFIAANGVLGGSFGSFF
jgi:hypothetical protein